MMRGATLQRVWDRLAQVGAIGLLVAVAVTGVDIVGRLTGVSLVHGAIDVVRISMVVSGAFAVATAMWRDANVRVDILSAGMSRRSRGWLDRMWRLVAAVLFGLMAWRCLAEALGSIGYGEVMAALNIPVGTLGLILSAGFVLGAVAGLLAVVSSSGGPERGSGS